MPWRAHRRHPGPECLIDQIRGAVIGDDTVLDRPLGPRRLVYADYAASGRASSFIEDYIRERVLPTYANTHRGVRHRPMCDRAAGGGAPHHPPRGGRLG
jgi:hypothetical protein